MKDNQRMLYRTPEVMDVRPDVKEFRKTITRRCKRNSELRIVHELVGVEASTEIILIMPILSL